MKRCLITGASRGIGRAIARRLADKDRALLLHGRDREALAETARLVEAQGGTPYPLCFDLSDENQVLELALAAGQQPLDVLVNNAGVTVVKPFDQLSLDEWHRTFAVNVTAPFLLTQKLLPVIPEGGSVVNILSVAARTGFPQWSSYCMSKAALDGFSLSIREELRSRGIRVINIYPAATDTGIWESIEGDWRREKMMAADEVAEALAFALERPAPVLIENITLGNLAGRL